MWDLHRNANKSQNLTNFIDNYNQFNMFRAIIYTESCKHSLVLPRMGEIIARNMLNWL